MERPLLPGSVAAVRARRSEQRPRCGDPRRDRPTGSVDGPRSGSHSRAGDARRFPQHLHLQALERPRLPLHDGPCPRRADLRSRHDRGGRSRERARRHGADPGECGRKWRQPQLSRLLRRLPPRQWRGPLLRGRHGRLLHLRRVGYREQRATHHADRDLRDQPRPHLHAQPRRPIRDRRDRIPVRAATNLRPAAGARRRTDQHPQSDIGVHRRLAASGAQPRGALAVRLRVELPRWAADLQPAGSPQSGHGGLLRHVHRPGEHRPVLAVQRCLRSRRAQRGRPDPDQ